MTPVAAWASVEARMKQVLRSLDSREVVDLTCRLVAVPTENPPANEAAVARILGDYLAAAGVSTEYTEVYPSRSNLTATLHGTSDAPRLLLTGHTDTMPLSGDWTDDPHGGVVRDGRLYGRGAADMKGGLAAMAVATAALARARLDLDGTLVLAAVIDEEKGSTGTRRLIDDGVQADYAIVGEPTSNVPVIASNGQLNFEFIIRGRAGHGSTPWDGRNAIYDGIRLVQAVRSLMESKFGQRSHPLVGPPSFSVGTFDGGIQTSVIPDHCRITLDRRVVPSETLGEAINEVKTLLDGLRSDDPGFNVAMEIFVQVEPVLLSEDDPLVRAMRWAAREVCGSDPGVGGLRATTDAAMLSKAGIPTLIMGPGSIDEAHKADEFAPVTDLVEAAKIYALGAARILASAGRSLTRT